MKNPINWLREKYRESKERKETEENDKKIGQILHSLYEKWRVVLRHASSARVYNGENAAREYARKDRFGALIYPHPSHLVSALRGCVKPQSLEATTN